MTVEQENDINNALLTLMYEWKTGAIDQKQALKEFKQCLKYYAIVENEMVFMEEKLISNDEIISFGFDRIVGYVKKELAERIGAEMLDKECVSFEQVEHVDECKFPYKAFRMKAVVVIPKPNPTKT
jgi:hypothetical protein